MCQCLIWSYSNFNIVDLVAYVDKFVSMKGLAARFWMEEVALHYIQLFLADISKRTEIFDNKPNVRI